MTESKSVALPLGYTPLVIWGERGELNPRVPESQSGALTTSPRPPQYDIDIEFKLKKWGERGELNPRVPESQSGALTTSPRPP